MEQSKAQQENRKQGILANMHQVETTSVTGGSGGAVAKLESNGCSTRESDWMEAEEDDELSSTPPADGSVKGPAVVGDADDSAFLSRRCS